MERQLKIAESELILNADGSIYHLNILPEDIADTIITVGDPERIKAITKYFDEIQVEKSKREFATVTGVFKGKRLTVISTGIGTDNIDIVFNELDALANIDLKNRTINERFRQLTFIRIGTTGGLQSDIPVDTMVASQYAVGMDGLMHFYDCPALDDTENEIDNYIRSQSDFPPYVFSGDKNLLASIPDTFVQGITVTCAGFYGPQNRSLRLNPKNAQFLNSLQTVEIEKNLKFVNFEMETAGIYGMASVLGHRAISLSVILANRATGHFSNDPSKSVDKLIENVLGWIE